MTRPTASELVSATVMMPVPPARVLPPVRTTGAATLAKSTLRTPPLTAIAPLITLAFAPLTVKVPRPTLVSERLPIVVGVKVPPKVELFSSRPTVKVVEAPALPIRPAPEREPTCCANALRSKLAPAASVSVVRTGSEFAVRKVMLPALTMVLPP